MLQIAFIRENQEKVLKALAKRNMDAKSIVELAVQLDEKEELHRLKWTIFCRNRISYPKT